RGHRHRRHRYRLWAPPPVLDARADRRGPRHADGRAAAALLASGGPRRRRGCDAVRAAGAGGGPGALPRRWRPAGPPRGGLRAPWHHAVLRARGGARDPLLLSRLALRRGRPLPGAAVRARRRPPARSHSPALVSRARALRADLGPLTLKPVLPRYEALERCEPDEQVEADGSSIGGGGPVVVPCNWLQHYENLMDTLHVPILHGSFSGPQFTAQMGLMPEATWAITERGVKAVSDRRLPDGTVHHRVSEAVVPTLRVIPNPRVAQYARVESIGWVLPIDDTHFRIYTAGRVRRPG